VINWLKRVILGFEGEAALVIVPTIDFENVPTVLPEAPSRFVAHFGEGFKKEGVVCGIDGGVVTIACMKRSGVIDEIVTRPTREVRLSMY